MPHRNLYNSDGYMDATMVAENALPNYLCSLALGADEAREKGAEMRLDICQTCEAQCAFARRMLEMKKPSALPTQTDKCVPSSKKGHGYDNTARRKKQGALAGGV